MCRWFFHCFSYCGFNTINRTITRIEDFIHDNFFETVSTDTEVDPRDLDEMNEDNTIDAMLSIIKKDIKDQTENNKK